MTEHHTFPTGLTQDQIAAMTIAFFAPADMRGKWHAKRIVTGVADCGVPVILGGDVIHATKQQLQTKTAHPIICRRCARLHGYGQSSTHVVQ